jgi:hypothetical protein
MINLRVSFRGISSDKEKEHGYERIELGSLGGRLARLFDIRGFVVLIVGGFASSSSRCPRPSAGMLHNEDYEKLGSWKIRWTRLRKPARQGQNHDGEAAAGITCRRSHVPNRYLAKQVDVQKSLLDKLNSQFKAISDNVASRLEAGFKNHA